MLYYLQAYQSALRSKNAAVDYDLKTGIKLDFKLWPRQRGEAKMLNSSQIAVKAQHVPYNSMICQKGTDLA